MITWRTVKLALALAAVLLIGRLAARVAYRITVLDPALGRALHTGDLPAAAALIARGADPNLDVDSHNLAEAVRHPLTPLGWAAVQSGPDDIGWLVSRGAKVNGTEAPGFTPLMAAAGRGLLQNAAALLRLGANPNAQDSHGRTALVYALDAAEPWPFASPRAAALMPRASRSRAIAVRSPAEPRGNAASVTQLLLRAGANPLVRDESGHTALALAEMAGAGAVVRIYRDRGVPGLHEELSGVPQSALFYAIRTGDRAGAMQLGNGADLNVEDRERMSPLMYAAQNPDGKLLAYLLKRGRNVRQALELPGGPYQETVLMQSATYGRLACVRELVRAGADVNAHGIDGDTALRFAQGQVRTVLLAAGAK